MKQKKESPSSTPEASLYGICKSNRPPKKYWGKNMFNSSFPISLACYMKDRNINAVYLKLDNNLNVIKEEIPLNEVFNSGSIPTNELFFGFESKFEPYQSFSYETIDGIDLILKDTSGNFLRPLEVKLTVVPDNSTCNLSEEKWGTELVIRPATTSYCALGIADSCKNQFPQIRDIFEPVCADIESWGNSTEMYAKKDEILDALDLFEKTFVDKQKPLILHPVWKTKGQSPYLSDNAFDIFIWSDFAFTRLFLDFSRQDVKEFGKKGKKEAVKNKISRQMRSSLRLARFLYEISKSGKVRLNDIYRQMTFSHQTDKEFSVNGRITNKYMKCDRLLKPVLPKEVVHEVILNGGESKLSPERRFDQTVYFTMTPR